MEYQLTDQPAPSPLPTVQVSPGVRATITRSDRFVQILSMSSQGHILALARDVLGGEAWLYDFNPETHRVGTSIDLGRGVAVGVAVFRGEPVVAMDSGEIIVVGSDLAITKRFQLSRQVRDIATSRDQLVATTAQPASLVQVDIDHERSSVIDQVADDGYGSSVLTIGGSIWWGLPQSGRLREVGADGTRRVRQVCRGIHDVKRAGGYLIIACVGSPPTIELLSLDSGTVSSAFGASFPASISLSSP